jgi:hypothetical protein
MSAIWLESPAWWGLLALALPIAIHLLTRQRRRTLAFPSLRFLQATRFAALKRRALSDAPLLVVRLLVMTAAVAAVAAPVFITPARRAAWDRRTARAIVEMWPNGVNAAAPPASAREIIAAEQSSAFVHRRDVAAGRAADAIVAAVEWLNRQPPAARELVIAGDMRAGLLTEADMTSIPAAVGIRFLPLAGEVPPRSLTWPVISTSAPDAGAAAVHSLTVTLDDEATGVVREAAARGRQDVLSVVASPTDAAVAAAIAEAVLAEGLVLSVSPARRVIVELQGAPHRPLTTPAPAGWMREVLEMVPGGGGERDGALVARVALPPSDPRAVHEVARIARAALTEPLDRFEPRRVSAATLAAWSRPPGGVPESAPIANERDGRWLWVVALALLAVEQVMRRRPAIAASRQTAAEEARVA